MTLVLAARGLLAQQRQVVHLELEHVQLVVAERVRLVDLKGQLGRDGGAARQAARGRDKPVVEEVVRGSLEPVRHAHHVPRP